MFLDLSRVRKKYRLVVVLFEGSRFETVMQREYCFVEFKCPATCTSADYHVVK